MSVSHSITKSTEYYSASEPCVLAAYSQWLIMSVLWMYCVLH